MKPMPACERASSPSASGRHSRMAAAKSPLLKAERPLRKSSSALAAKSAGIAAARQPATAIDRASNLKVRFNAASNLVVATIASPRPGVGHLVERLGAEFL